MYRHDTSFKAHVHVCLRYIKKKVCSNSTDLILFTKLISLSESVKLHTGERQEAFKTQDVHDSG